MDSTLPPWSRSLSIWTNHSECGIQHKVQNASCRKFRHGDHRFEWSREQFRSWANGIAERFGYNVEIKPVADEDPQVGSPTQMGVSTRGNLLAYLTTEVARTIGRFVHRVTVIWASRFHWSTSPASFIPCASPAPTRSDARRPVWCRTTVRRAERCRPSILLPSL